MSISHTPSVEDVAAALAMFGLSQHEPAVLGSLAAATDLRSLFLSVGILQAGELVDYLAAAGDEKGTVLVRIASGRASAAMSSSTILSENTISKLLSRMDTVCVALSFAVGAVASDLRGAAVNFKFLAQRRCRHQAQWLQKQSDEVDAVEKLFLACARLCTASTSDLGVLYSTFLEVSPLLSAHVLPAFTSYSSMDVAIVADFRAVLNEMTSLQSVPVDVLDVGRPGLRFCHPGKINSLQFQLIGNGGAPLSGLSPDDVSVSVPVGDATVGAVDALTGSFSISYSVPSTCQDKSMTLIISSWGALVKEIEIPIGATVQGAVINIYPIINPERNWGMAVHPDGKAFVVTNWGTCMLSVYALPTGECVRSLNGGTIDGTDGCAKFYTPCKVCFAPNGHLLVSEDSNKRVQELTFEGQFVRFIGNEVIDDDVVGLAADSKHIAVGKFGPGHQVFLFDFYTGSLIRSFGSSDISQGVYRMSMCHGIRFTADGQHLIVASYATNSVLTFTLAGEVVSMFEVNEPRDVQVAPNGDVVVTGRAEVHVFNRNGSPLRSFGSTGSEPGQFKLDSVYALAWWGAHLFVLDNKNGRVQVFE